MNVGVLGLAVSAVHQCVQEKEQQLLGQWSGLMMYGVCLFANIVLMDVQIKVRPRLRQRRGPPLVGLRLAAHPLF